MATDKFINLLSTVLVISIFVTQCTSDTSSQDTTSPLIAAAAAADGDGDDDGDTNDPDINSALNNEFIVEPVNKRVGTLQTPELRAAAAAAEEGGGGGGLGDQEGPGDDAEDVEGGQEATEQDQEALPADEQADNWENMLSDEDLAELFGFDENGEEDGTLPADGSDVTGTTARTSPEQQQQQDDDDDDDDDQEFQPPEDVTSSTITPATTGIVESAESNVTESEMLLLYNEEDTEQQQQHQQQREFSSEFQDPRNFTDLNIEQPQNTPINGSHSLEMSGTTILLPQQQQQQQQQSDTTNDSLVDNNNNTQPLNLAALTSSTTVHNDVTTGAVRTTTQQPVTSHATTAWSYVDTTTTTASDVTTQSRDAGHVVFVGEEAVESELSYEMTVGLLLAAIVGVSSVLFVLTMYGVKCCRDSRHPAGYRTLGDEDWN